MGFPKWKYHRTEKAKIVDTAADESALGEGWEETPAAFAGEGVDEKVDEGSELHEEPISRLPIKAEEPEAHSACHMPADPEYDSMTNVELKVLAKEKGIKGTSSMNKAELIAALEG